MKVWVAKNIDKFHLLKYLEIQYFINVIKSYYHLINTKNTNCNRNCTLYQYNITLKYLRSWWPKEIKHLSNSKNACVLCFLRIFMQFQMPCISRITFMQVIFPFQTLFILLLFLSLYFFLLLYFSFAFLMYCL